MELLAFLNALGTELDSTTTRKFGPLEIGVMSCGASWVELCGTCAVGVTAAHGRSSLTGGAGFHK